MLIACCRYVFGIVEVFRPSDCAEEAPTVYKLTLVLVVVFLSFVVRCLHTVSQSLVLNVLVMIFVLLVVLCLVSFCTVCCCLCLLQFCDNSLSLCVSLAVFVFVAGYLCCGLSLLLAVFVLVCVYDCLLSHHTCLAGIQLRLPLHLRLLSLLLQSAAPCGAHARTATPASWPFIPETRSSYRGNPLTARTQVQ